MDYLDEYLKSTKQKYIDLNIHSTRIKYWLNSRIDNSSFECITYVNSAAYKRNVCFYNKQIFKIIVFE